MKILFDTNFLNAYNTCQNSAIKDKIKALVDQNKVQFYLNDILTFEWLAIFDTNHKYLLSEYAKTFVDLKVYPCFKQIHKILNAEIGISQESDYFEDQKTIEKMQKLFQNLAKGHIFVDVQQINSILQKMREYRKNWFFPQQTDIIPRNEKIKRNKSLRRNALRYDFNGIYNLDPVFDQRKSWVHKHFNEGKKEEIIPMSRVEKCLTNIQDFPYINIWVRTRWALQYLYVVSGRRVDENDLFDSYQLIYTTYLDHFLTEEKRLKLISEMVFQNKSKTLNFKEFCQKL